MWILILGITLRAIWLIVLALNRGFSFEGDIVGYIDNAESVVNEGHLIYDGLRTPGYPLIIAGFMFLTKTHYYLCVCIFQNIFNIIAVCAVYQIIVILTSNQTAACIGGAIAAINIHDIYYSNLLLTDSIAQSLTIVSLLFLLMFMQKKITVRRRDICVLVL